MKVSNGKFYGNPSSVNCAYAFGRADMTKGIALCVTIWTHQKCMNLMLYFWRTSITAFTNYSFC